MYIRNNVAELRIVSEKSERPFRFQETQIATLLLFNLNLSYVLMIWLLTYYY